MGVIALLAYWLYRRAYSVNPSTYLGKLTNVVVQNIRSYDGIGRKYVTLLSFPDMDLDTYFTELQNIGIDGVFPSVQFSSIVKADGSYDYTKWDAFFNIAMAKGIQVFPNLLFKMGVGEWSDYGFQPSDRWLNADGNLYGNGSVSARYDSPIWKSHFEPFVTNFCQRYQDYFTKGWMPGISFANTIQHEFGFNHDYEPIGNLTYKQKHDLLKNCFEGLTAAAGNIPTCFHSGEFQTEISLRVATLGFRNAGAKAGWFKQNPNNKMDIDYVVRNTVTDTKGSIIELTYTEGDNEFTLSTKAGRCFQLGADIVTFAFVEGQTGLEKLRAIKNEMVAKGVWNSQKGSLPAFTYTVNVSDMIANGGYFLSAFKAAYQGGVPPKVLQVYNL